MNPISHLRRNIARLSLIALTLTVITVGLAACGGAEATPTPTTAVVPGGNTGGAQATTAITATTAPSPTAASGSGSGAGGGPAQEIKATLKEWSITLTADTVSAGNVKFVVTNEGQNGHDLSVLDSSGTAVGTTPVFKSADGPKELTVNLKPGEYTVICDVPGHKQQGMMTTLTVK